MSARAQRYREARRDPEQVVLEGLHAVKHAARFGARITDVAVTDRAGALLLADALAPELRPELEAAAEIGADELNALVPRPPRTGVVALAARPQQDAEALLVTAEAAPIVLLEDPRHAGNVGAVVRVAAAAGAAAVLTTGSLDPWGPDAVRGAAGLQFALPVARLQGDLPRLPAGPRPRRLVAIDPLGDALPGARGLTDGPAAPAIVAFGTERHGLSPALLALADDHVSLPMERGVSSLNLATAVSAVLYHWRLGRPGS